jgi:hypothetical protein
MKNNKIHTLQVRVTPEQFQKLEILAKKNKVTISKQIRQILENN